MKYIINIIRILFLTLFIVLLAKGKVLLWLALFAISLLAALIFGRIYCGYMCPMNTLMIPASWLSKKLKLQTSNTPKWLKNGYFAWLSFGVSVAGMFLSKALLHINLPILPFWLLVSIIITLRYKPAVFHNLICPFGALQKTFGQLAILSEKVDKTTCIGCKICEKVCPSNAIFVSLDDDKAIINTALCHQCKNCVQVCPTNAIHYKNVKNNN